jgi:hypothetical protein
MDRVRVENFEVGEPPIYRNTFEYACPECGKRHRENRAGPHPLPLTIVNCGCGFQGFANMPWLDNAA